MSRLGCPNKLTPEDEWVDEIAVERAVVGRESVGRPLTIAEKLLVIDALRGLTLVEIARRVEMSTSAVKWRLAQSEQVSA